MRSYDDDLEDDNAPPSKTQKKREKEALQELGKKIIDLPDGHFVRIPLSETMLDAMALYKRLKSHEARRRQLQFIGKHMHTENLEAIRVAIDQFDADSKQFRQHFHKLETLRDQLVENGDSALEALMNEYPDLNRQEIRQLIRQAAREQQQSKPPAARRKLFKYLREHIEIGN